MDCPKLRKMKNDLLVKATRTKEENELLEELKSLDLSMEKKDFSLAMSGSICPTCGRTLSK